MFLGCPIALVAVGTPVLANLVAAILVWVGSRRPVITSGRLGALADVRAIVIRLVRRCRITARGEAQYESYGGDPDGKSLDRSSHLVRCTRIAIE